MALKQAAAFVIFLRQTALALKGALAMFAAVTIPFAPAGASPQAQSCLGFDGYPSPLDVEHFYAVRSVDIIRAGNRHFVGVDNMMWSNDYPHHRHDLPYSRRIIEEGFLNVPAEEKAKMICGNAVELYQLGPLRNGTTRY
jgi:hypothetical protein